LSTIRLGQPDARGDSGGGDGVCRSHDGAEHEAEAPVEAVEYERRHWGNTDNSESDQAEGQEKDADEVVPEVAQDVV
jgi:hypothetical protein